MQVVFALLLTTLLVTTTQAQTLMAEFAPHQAAGVSGTISVQYTCDKSSMAMAPATTASSIPAATSTAIVKADLDFTHADFKMLAEMEPSCRKGPIDEFNYHIHVKWSSNTTSAAFGQCSLIMTGNHYDPTAACSTDSEFVATAWCPAQRILSYSCTPSSYRATPSECEKGDLSGKLGALRIRQQSRRAMLQGQDMFFPTFAEATPQWNIVLHAVCGKKAVRMACARLQPVSFAPSKGQCQQK